MIELGPLNATIHQVNEHIAAADVACLSDIYERIAARLLGGDPAGATASAAAQR